MLALLSGLGIKDCIYAFLIIALGAFLVYERTHLINEGKKDVLTALAASTAKLTAANNAALAKQAGEDAAAITAVETSYAKALATSNAATAALSGRLRDYLAARSGEATVPGNPATPGKPDGSAAVTSGVDSALAGVIGAAGHDAQQVIALQQYVTDVCLR